MWEVSRSQQRNNVIKLVAATQVLQLKPQLAFSRRHSIIETLFDKNVETVADRNRDCTERFHPEVLHHIIPRRQGGTNSLDNLIVLCPNHHAMADRNLISRDELIKLNHAAIAQQPEIQLQFHQQPHTQHSTSQETLSFFEPEPDNQLCYICPKQAPENSQCK